jgi:hypothetical protein
MQLPEINERRCALVVFSYMGLMLFVGLASEFAQSAALSWLALRLGLFFLWASYGFIAVVWAAALAGLLSAAFGVARRVVAEAWEKF